MSQKPHLDDFFRAARREDPVISHEEIGELMDARRTEHTFFTQHITWKGIGMTTVGFGLAAVLSYFAFFTSADNSGNPPVVRTASTTPSPVSAEIKTLVTPREPTLQPHAASEVREVEASEEEVRVEAPIKVDEVRITEPSENDMKRLGMKVDGGREVVVVKKVGKKFFIATFAAQPFSVNVSALGENPTDIEPSSVFPVFVTSLDGRGVMTARTPDENTTIATREVHNASKEGEGAMHEKSSTIILNSDDGISSHSISADVNIEISDDSKEGGEQQEEQKIHKGKKLKVLVNTDPAAVAESNGAAAQTIIVNDDLDATVADSLPHRKQLKKIRIISDNHEGIDSLCRIIVSEMRLDTFISSLPKKQDLSKMELKFKEMKEQLGLNNINMEDLQSRILKAIEQVGGASEELETLKNFHMNAKVMVLPSFSELKAKLNELVPIRVPLSSDKGSGLIFWYEPSATPAVPKQEAQAVSSSVIENVTINPNPARDHATVRFTIKDARAVTITVHDILGKRLLEAGQVTAGAGGAFSREIDLSSLTQGVYLIVLTTDTGEQRIERILVNK